VDFIRRTGDRNRSYRWTKDKKERTGRPSTERWGTLANSSVVVKPEAEALSAGKKKPWEKLLGTQEVREGRRSMEERTETTSRGG